MDEIVTTMIGHHGAPLGHFLLCAQTVAHEKLL